MAGDEYITEQCNADINKGFPLLMKAYQQKVYWHIRRLVVSHEDAEDLLQDVFVKIYSRWDTFRGDSSLATWIYRIATNECLTFLNRQKIRMANEGGDANDMSNLLASSEYTEYGDKLVTALQEAVLKLPEMQRLVFNMRYYDNMSYQDIAQVTGSSTSAAKTNYHIAKGKVTEYVKQIF